MFLGGVSLYTSTPLIVALSPGHNDLTRFRSWASITTGNHLDRAKKIPKVAQRDWHRWRFWSALGHFWTHFAESFLMSKSSWMMDPTHSREMPSCSAIDLAEIRRSSKISSWIWSIISGVVTVLGRPGRGATQVKKSPRLKWTTKYLTVAYDSAYSSNVCFRMAWISFGVLPCRKRNLMTARVSMLLKSRASPDMLLFSLCNKKSLAIRHVTPLSNDTTDSVLRLREIVRAKDLSALPRTLLSLK